MSGETKLNTRRSTPRQSTMERQRQIIDQAAFLFDRNGYHATSMDDIAESVGIQKATVYYHFESKDQILLRIHREFMELMQARQLALSQIELSARQMLYQMFVDMLEAIDTHHAHVRVFFENYRELSEKSKALVQQERQQYHSLVEDIVSKGVERGEFRQVDISLTTLGIFGMCNWAYRWYRRDGKSSPQEIAHTFWDMCIRGLEA